jgi:hypothetical protein
MNNIQFMQVLNSSYNLVEKFASFWFFDSLVGNDVVKEFSSTGIFHYQIELLGRLNNLLEE